jgi:CheY-like chemotaxis protein
MGTTTTFLLVEDDPDDVFMVEREFKRAPHLQLRHVSDGRKAVLYLLGEEQYKDREKYPLPDVILLDLKMPRFSGFDFLQWLRSNSPGSLRLVPVMVMSSSPLHSDVQRAYAIGVNSYMCKPVDWSKFRERIQTLGIYWSEVETPKIPSVGNK